MGILVKFESVVITIERRLQVSQDRIDPMKTIHIGAFALGADNFTLMDAANRFNGSKASQTVGNDCCGRF